MNDRDLLVLAAKASGYRVKFGASGDPYIQAGINTRAWNPLTNDGDALRLAVKLSLYDDDLIDHLYRHSLNEDYAATRRSIVRAAAEIGRDIP